MVVLVLASEARADQGGEDRGPFPVGLGVLKIVGLDDVTTSATQDFIASALRDLGGDVTILKTARAADRRCLQNRRCLTKTAAKRGLSAVLLITAVRIGPTVQINLRALRADTGMEVRSAVLTPDADGFPESWDIKGDLESVASAFDAWQLSPEEVPETAASVEGASDTSPSAPLAHSTDPSPAAEATKPIVEPVVAEAPGPFEVGPRSPFVLPLAIGGGAFGAVGAGLTGFAVHVRQDATSSGDAKSAALTIGRLGLSLVAVGVGAVVTAGVMWLVE